MCAEIPVRVLYGSTILIPTIPRYLSRSDPALPVLGSSEASQPCQLSATVFTKIRTVPVSSNFITDTRLSDWFQQAIMWI